MHSRPLTSLGNWFQDLSEYQRLFVLKFFAYKDMVLSVFRKFTEHDCYKKYKGLKKKLFKIDLICLNGNNRSLRCWFNSQMAVPAGVELDSSEELGARNSILLSHVDNRAQVLRPVCCLRWCVNRGLDQEQSSWNSKQVFTKGMVSGIRSVGFARCTTKPAPQSIGTRISVWNQLIDRIGFIFVVKT